MRLKKEKLRYVILAILLLEVLTLTYFTYKYGFNHIDTDDSAELILAELLNKEKSLVSPNWYYSTELRVLNIQMIMAPLFSIFSSWRMIRTVGTCILLCILVLSWLYLCSKTCMGRIAFWFSPLILWPFSNVYYDFVLFGLYYIPHLSIVFTSLGLIAATVNNERFRKLNLIKLCILSCLAGLGGLRLVVVLYLSLFLASCIKFVCEKEKYIQLKEDAYLSYSAIAMFLACVGYFINSKVFSKLYTFTNWEDTKFVELDLQQVGTLLNDTMKALGYRSGREIISISGIVNILILISSVIILYVLIILVWNWKKMGEENRLLILYSVLSFAITVAIGLFTNQGWSTRYLLIPIINYIIVLSIYIGCFGLSHVRHQLLSLCLIGTMLLSGGVEYRAWAAENKNGAREIVLSYLKKQGFKFGYANWQNADVLTELSDGEIRMCKVTDWSNFSIWYWLMDKEYLRSAGNESVFILLENSELNFDVNDERGYLHGSWTLNDLTYLDDKHKVYQDEVFSVYSYANQAELDHMLSGVR